MRPINRKLITIEIVSRLKAAANIPCTKITPNGLGENAITASLRRIAQIQVKKLIEVALTLFISQIILAVGTL